MSYSKESTMTFEGSPNREVASEQMSASQFVDRVWQGPTECTEVDTLPPLSPKHFPLEDRIQMYSLVHASWEDLYQPNMIISQLRSPERSSIHRKRMKQVRKHGLLLNSAFIHFDECHRPPLPHKQFTKLLGEFNDYYATPDHEHCAEKVVAHIEEQYRSTESLQFTPASDESFADRLALERSKVVRFSQQERLIADDYHLMRKILRGIMNSTRMASAVKNDSTSRAYRDFLIKMNDELGDVHDRLVQADYVGLLDYKTTFVTLPPDMKKKVEVFLRGTEQLAEKTY